MNSGLPRRPSRRLWLLVAGGAALGVLAAYIGLRMAPTAYRATATLLVAPSEAAPNQSYQRTYAQMAVHPAVLGRVRELLSLNVPVARLEEAVTARPVPDTQLVEISAQTSDADRAWLRDDVGREAAAGYRWWVSHRVSAADATSASRSRAVGKSGTSIAHSSGSHPSEPTASCAR